MTSAVEKGQALHTLLLRLTNEGTKDVPLPQQVAEADWGLVIWVFNRFPQPVCFDNTLEILRSVDLLAGVDLVESMHLFSILCKGRCYHCAGNEYRDNWDTLHLALHRMWLRREKHEKMRDIMDWIIEHCTPYICPIHTRSDHKERMRARRGQLLRY